MYHILISCICNILCHIKYKRFNKISSSLVSAFSFGLCIWSSHQSCMVVCLQSLGTKGILLYPPSKIMNQFHRSLKQVVNLSCLKCRLEVGCCLNLYLKAFFIECLWFLPNSVYVSGVK